MRRFIDRIEKYLVRLIVISLVAVVVIQGLMTEEPLRLYLSWGERLEGEMWEYPAAAEPPGDALPPARVESPDAIMTIMVEQFSALPNTIVLVNGKERARFHEREVRLQLMAGDVVEIDSTAYNFPIDYRIDSVSDNLSFPEKDTAYTANRTMVMVGKIIVK